MNTDQYMPEFFSREEIENILQLTTNAVNSDGVRYKIVDYEQAIRYWSLKCSYEANRRATAESRLEIIKMLITVDPPKESS